MVPIGQESVNVDRGNLTSQRASRRFPDLTAKPVSLIKPVVETPKSLTSAWRATRR